MSRSTNSMIKGNLTNLGGRPTVITDDVVQKLENVFKLGVTDAVACNYAKIAERTFYDHLRSDEGFRSLIQAAKDYARILACSVVIDAIKNKDIQAAKWFLEKRYPEEFGTQVPTVLVQNNQISNQVVSTQDRETAIKDVKEALEALERTGDYAPSAI